MVLRFAWLFAGLPLVTGCGSPPSPPPTPEPNGLTCQSEGDCINTPATPECALFESPDWSPQFSVHYCSLTAAADGGYQTTCQTVTGTASQCVSQVDSVACTSDADCTDPAAFCSGPDVGLASGVCSRRCDLWGSEGPCGAGATCAVDPATMTQTCLASCQSGAWCPTGFACDPAYDLAVGPQAKPPQGLASGTSPSQWLCVPYCTTDAQCTGGACNPYTHRCETVDDSLQDDGAPCAAPGDCRSGQCETAGFLDGFCSSACIQPDETAYESDTLPGADCPGTEVCAPDPSGGANVLSRCFPRCVTDADCRADYVCVHPQTPGPGPRTVDGFCDARSDPLSTL